MTQIECIDLSLGYEGRLVTEGLNFSVNEGDYLCIVGENGSGKTTLMRALLRQKSPISGEIRFGDLLPTEIGYLPQQTQAQSHFPASVFEVVVSGCLSSMEKRFFFTKSEKARAYKNMEKLGISERAYSDIENGRSTCGTLTAIMLLMYTDNSVMFIQHIQARFEEISAEEK